MDCYIPKDTSKKLISELFDPGLCKDINCPELLFAGYTSYVTAIYNCQRFKLSKNTLRLLADRKSFSEYVRRFYEENPNILKSQLVELVHKDMEKMMRKFFRKSEIKKSEIENKIDIWFSKDYDISLATYKSRRRFETIEKGRERIKEFLINNPEKRSKREIQKELKIGLYTYFESMNEALEYAGIPYKDSKRIKSDIKKL